MPRLKSETIGTGDQSWLGSAHAIRNARTELLDISTSEMLKLFNYVSDMGGRAISPEITNINQEFESFRSVFEQALQQEIYVTQQFNRMAAKCMKTNDFVTFQFIQWFLNEQIEEEYVARRALELFEVIGEEGTGRYEIDKRVPKIKYDK